MECWKGIIIYWNQTNFVLVSRIVMPMRTIMKLYVAHKNLKLNLEHKRYFIWTLLTKSTYNSWAFGVFFKVWCAFWAYSCALQVCKWGENIVIITCYIAQFSQYPLKTNLQVSTLKESFINGIKSNKIKIITIAWIHFTIGEIWLQNGRLIYNKL